MPVCKMYFVLLLLYAVINLLGERSQTAQREERREKGREVVSRSVSVLLFKKDIQESDFIFVSYVYFELNAHIWMPKTLWFRSFAKYPVRERRPASFGERLPLSLTHLNHLHLGLRYCFIFCCSNGSEAVFCFWPRRTQATLRIYNG